MKRIFISNTPLPAGGVLTSPWLDRSGSGDVPFVTVSILSDQAGSFLLYESETAAMPTGFQTPDATGQVDDAAVIGGGTVAPNIATVASVNLNRRRMCIVYTNGPTAQTVCSIALVASTAPHIAPVSKEWRALDLILRELRVHSLLLDNLRNPAGSTVNVPFGPTNSSN